MRHYFIGSKYYGAYPPSYTPVHSTMEIPFGKAFFCPVCAEVWALAPIDGKETYPETILCEKHEFSPSRSIPGGLFLAWDTTWNKDLPLELLAREYLILLRLWEAHNDVDIPV